MIMFIKNLIIKIRDVLNNRSIVKIKFIIIKTNILI